jgi:hypothetical protein
MDLSNLLKTLHKDFLQYIPTETPDSKVGHVRLRENLNALKKFIDEVRRKSLDESPPKSRVKKMALNKK